MMPALKNKNALFELLAQGATVITPNNRLSSFFLQEYFESQQKKNLDKPLCMPYSSFIMECFARFKWTHPSWDFPVLLNSAQCRHLWRSIIASNTQIPYSEGLLLAIVRAFEHCQLWQISPKHPAFDQTPQTEQFQAWWQTLEDYLKKNNAITEQQIIPWLIEHQYQPTQAKHHSESKPIIIWACFDDFTPQQLSFQTYLGSQDCLQYQYDLFENNNEPFLCRAKDRTEEYEQLIMWLNLRLIAGDRRIGVVVPNLNQESRFIKRILSHHLDEDLFNISLGQPLIEYPLVAHALTWLALDGKNLSNHQAHLLLQSPYLCSSKEELIHRAHMAQESTLLQRQDIPFSAFVQALRPKAQKLSECLVQLKPYPKKASPEEWIDAFQNRLNGLGFPGEYGLNSENYQCYNRFSTVFDAFRQLSIISPSLSGKEALNAMHHLMGETIFQAQKKHAVIQVLGILEASGCAFDSLWVMGLTDQCLPQKTHLSPFIPASLQRELLMPHSVPSREFRFAKQTLERLRKGSLNTVLSYPMLDEDAPRLPSPLVTHFPDHERLTAPTSLNTPAIIEDDTPYSVPIGPHENISGGTALLANQAKCPFKAFAEHRLKAKPALPLSEGLEAREKGQILHHIMELFWKDLGGQADLLALSPEALNQHIDKVIYEALSPYTKTHAQALPELVQEVELTRLKRLVHSVIDWEKERPAFSIEAIEQSYTIELAGLELSVRVDRLDKVAQQKWVIDYKSNIPTHKPWNEERPREPQLLLYALLDEEINALILLQLKNGAIHAQGLSEEKYELKGLSALKKDQTWTECMSTWRQQLTDLALEFKQGHVTPSPTDAGVCQHCDFQNLCRFEI